MSEKRKYVYVMICTIFFAGISMLIARHFGHPVGRTTGTPWTKSTTPTKSEKPAVEPTSFYEDDDSFKYSVPIPDNVIDVLRNSEEAKEMQNELKDYDRDDFARLFKAVVIHLGGTDEINYVVMGEYPMGGADAPWFWIVRYDQSHPKLIFYTFAGGFSLLKTRNSGYPDIRSDAGTASIEVKEIYHYNGQQYILVHKYEKER
jgi:hypothetical protein